ncbi:MAG TPA: hypothetical protein VGP73_18580 [Thermoanaerobaculia bacterium]
MRRIALFLLAFVLPVLAKASDLTIVFGNGMQADQEAAKASLAVLRKAVLADPRFTSENLDFNLAYNTTQCSSLPDGSICLLDLYESVKQAAIPLGLRIDDVNFWLYLSLLKTEPADEFKLFSQVAESILEAIS